MDGLCYVLTQLCNVRGRFGADASAIGLFDFGGDQTSPFLYLHSPIPRTYLYDSELHLVILHCFPAFYI